MVILDGAGSLLPDGLRFLKPAWWLLHVIVAGLVFAYGYRKGRSQERREQREREPKREKDRPPR
jgi:hypothetical protein